MKLVVQILIRAAIVAVIPIGLKVYNMHYLKTLTVQKSQVKSELEDKKKEVKELDKKIKAYGGLSNDAKEFDEKIKILKTLAKERFKVIKILDSIQSNMGLETDEETAGTDVFFFKNINITGRNISITGVTSDEQNIKSFLLSLEKEQLYENVHLENVRSNQNDAYKHFSIKGLILETI